MFVSKVRSKKKRDVRETERERKREKGLTVKSGTFLHFRHAKNTCDFNQRVTFIMGDEKGVSTSEQG
jgi:hypothetical protein